MSWCRSYGRKSRALGDPDDPHVVAHQLAACDRLAAEDGRPLLPAERIAEVGSGESLSARPRFLALLTELERRPPPGGGILYVTEVSRLSRADMEEVGRIMRVLRQAGVIVRTPGRRFDLTNPDDEMFFTWMAAGSRNEVQRFKVRVQQRMDLLLSKGRLRDGHAPLGYVYDRNTRSLLPDPERFPILVACCREVLTTSVQRLAERYSLSPSALYSALVNPKICGWPSVHKFKLPGRRLPQRVPRDLIRWAGQENTDYPHACTRAEFERIQEVLHERNKWRKKTAAHAGWCRDVVVFPGHDGRVRLSNVTGSGSSPDRQIYECRVQTPSQGRPKRVAWIERQKVHEAATAALTRLFSDPAVMAFMVQRAIDNAERETKPAGPAPGEVERLKQQYQEAVDAEFDAEEPLRSALRRRRERLEKEVKRVQAEQERALRPARSAAQVRAALQELPAIARRFATAWERYSEEQKRELAQLCIARIEVRCSCEPKKGIGAGRITTREVAAVVLQPWFQP